MTRLLLLSGSSEASILAQSLANRRSGLEIGGPDPQIPAHFGEEVTVIRSLAGVTSSPAPVPGELRIGGFGGADGLAAYLRDTGVDLLVDATHPFARRMPWHAAAAAERTGTPRLRVLRPPWTPGPDDDWHRVPDLAAVAAALEAVGSQRPFLALGRIALADVGALPGRSVLVRSVEPVVDAPFALAASVVGRGPFTLDDELALLREHRSDALVTRNSGGTAAAAKLEAARRLGLPVVVVDRPPQPDGPTAAGVDDALSWIRAEAARDRSRRGSGPHR